MFQLDLYNDEYSAKSADAPYGVSAGGVVFRRVGNAYEFLLLVRDKDGDKSYHLPKGTLNLNETLEHCAEREITEESGVSVQLKTYLGGKHAVFEFKGKHNDKIFHYYAAEYIAEAGAMDDEHDFREWVSYEDAVEKLQSNEKREDIFLERCMEYLNSEKG